MAEIPRESAQSRPPHWRLAPQRHSPLLFLLSDVVVLVTILLADIRLRPESPEWGPGSLAIVVAWALALGHYTRRLPPASEIGHLAQGVCLLAVAEIAARHYATGQWEVAAAAERGVAVLVLLLTGRHVVRRLLMAARLWQIPVLVVADGAADRIAAAINSARAQGYCSVGVLSPHLGKDDPNAQVARICAKTGARMAVLDLETAYGDDGRRLIRALRANGLAIALAPSFSGLPVLGIQAQTFFSHDVVLLTADPGWGRKAQQYAKRLVDMMAAGALLLLAAPALALIALAVKLDGGPLLFGHVRIGRNGRPFRCWKFRTMVPNAEAVLKEVLASDPARAEEWRQSCKLKQDPRVTAVGNFLRRTSLDELPQLLNVLVGQMSLIGPRPVTEAELERYGDAQEDYLSVRPGITGLWQVLGRNNASYAQRVLLDAWYVRNWSPWHDLLILLKTIPVVLRRDGAY